jgi:hypothetical protein
MYLVTYFNQLDASTYYLRATILTSDRARATVYPTLDAAKLAIEKAKPFHKARVHKGLTIAYNAPASVETLTTV